MPTAFPRKGARAAGATAFAFAWACASGAAIPVRAQATAAPVTPVLPTRGGTPWSAADIAKLDADVGAMLATDPALRGAHAGVLAVDTASGNVLFARGADEEFQPASTLKLLVGSAALERLGPAFRFRTQIETTEPGPSGAPAVLLRAGGDPFLVQSDFDDAAATIARAGIGAIGDAFVDDSHDEDAPYAPGWTWDDFAYDYAPRVSAMAFEENVVHLTVAPGTVAGANATVSARPPAVVTAPAGGCEAARTSSIVVTPLVVTGEHGSASTVDVRLGRGGCLEAFGTTPLGGNPESIDAAAYAPLAYARGALLSALRARSAVPSAPSAIEATPGGSADVPFRRIESGGRLLWQHDSAPLRAWLGPKFWIPSDNLTGELLLDELGYATAGAPGSRAGGIAVETAWLTSIGVDPATVTLADGCGMSQYDRITPRDLVAILQHDWHSSNRDLVLASLPVGGARGTIEGIAGTPAAGRVFAKTGSMMHVRGLAGFLATRRHGSVTFAFNVDDWIGDYASLARSRARVLARIVSD